jgi:outer membrane protein assembly factor BamB
LRRFLFALVSLSGAIFAGAADRGAGIAPVGPDFPAPTPGRRVPSEWPKYCGNIEMTGHASRETRISTSTAASLILIWSRQLDGTVASAPSVAGGAVFVGDWSGREWALDPVTGAVKASADLGSTHAPQCSPPDLGVTSSPLVAEGRIYLAGGDDSFYGLNADDLSVAWKLRLGDNAASGGYYGWCSPTMVSGKLLQGVSSNCDNPFIPGKIVSIDASTGELLQETYFVDSGQLGGGEWTSPAVDPAAGTVFVSTASSLGYTDRHAYSILRLSLGDLGIEDFWKLDPVLVDDADWGSSPTLFTDGAGRRLVGAGQKDGGYYAFSRDDLAAGPIWRAPIAVGGDCPQCAQGTLSTAAFDGSRLYVGGGLPPGQASQGVRGSVASLDPATGDIVWRFAGFPGPVIAPVSTANGAVFAVGGNLAVGLDAQSGSVLWSFTTAADGYGGIAIADGRIFFGDLAGNFYAFGLGE